MVGSLRKSIYKWAWDTRCRNRDVARVLRPVIDGGSTILDAGCGEYGLTEFVSAKKIVGVDILSSDQHPDGLDYVCGSIIALPFGERSFSIAASVDVLEHLPDTVRGDAIRQLVRVADKAIVITYPAGKQARRIDENFNTELVESDQPVPDWLSEHLQYKYPENDMVISEIQREAGKLGRRVRTSVSYSEDLRAARFLRWSAVRSRYLYLIANLGFGLLLPVLPRANREAGYRSIVLAEFVND